MFQDELQRPSGYVVSISETKPFHHVPRRRGCRVAARGARAAGRARAAHRRAHERGRGRPGRTGPAYGIRAGTAAWTDGRNVRIDYRWGGGDADRIRRYAAELVAIVGMAEIAVSDGLSRWGQMLLSASSSIKPIPITSTASATGS
jgi:hypothetical protein